MKDTRELIDTFLSKRDDVYVPPGKVTWRLPTGILTLDRVLGGGFPGGSIIQIYGPEKAGKTTLAYHTAAQAVKAGYSTLLIPLEKYSEQYAEACGLDVHAKNLNIVAADYAELVFNLCIEAIRNYDAKVIVMDSISAATPKADLEKRQKTEDMDKGFNIGSQARAVSDFIRKIQQPIRRKEAIFLTVNQLSMEISHWGGIAKPKGGMALQYFSDIKLSMWGKENKETQAIETRVTVNKGKDWDVIPFGTANLFIYHAKGIDVDADLIMACEKAGIIEKKGSWYAYGEAKAQGMDKFGAILKDDPELRKELFDKATSVDIEIEKEKPEEDESEEISDNSE